MLYPVQVQDSMRVSKLTLQKLVPGTAAAAQAISSMQPAGPEEDDSTCIICLDQPASVTFHPCGHSVTCATCAALVTKAGQPCPLCRSLVVSLHS